MASFSINSSKLLQIGAGMDAEGSQKYGNHNTGSFIHEKRLNRVKSSFLCLEFS